MITMLGSRRRCCDGLTRRETLKAGALGLAGGFHLPGLLRAEEARGAGRPRQGQERDRALPARRGAHPGHVRPEARRPRGGPGRVQADRHERTGVQIGDHLPLTARWMHRAALVRSVNHKSGCHNPLPSYTGFEGMLTDIVSTRDSLSPQHGLGLRVPQGRARPLARVYVPAVLPRMGPVDPPPRPVCRLPRQAVRRALHRVQPLHRQGRAPERPGYPQVLRGEPRIPDSTPGEGITIDRFHARRTMLQQFDDQVRRAEGHPALGTFDRYQARAFELMTSAKVKAAFHLDDEDPKLRDRYGRTLFGSSA